MIPQALCYDCRPGLSNLVSVSYRPMSEKPPRPVCEYDYESTVIVGLRRKRPLTKVYQSSKRKKIAKSYTRYRESLGLIICRYSIIPPLLLLPRFTYRPKTYSLHIAAVFLCLGLLRTVVTPKSILCIYFKRLVSNLQATLARAI